MSTARRPAVDETRFRGEPAIELAVGDLTATFLPDLGLTGVSLLVAGRQHLAVPGGPAALRAGHTAGLPLLAPWANRLGGRRYRAAGVAVDLAGLDLDTDANGLPIHGLLVGRPGWRIDARGVRRGRPSFRAAIDVEGPAFPFPHRLEVTVAAADRSLTVDTTLVPTGRRRVPVAFGWHPYLRLPGAPRRRWQLVLPPRTHLELDARGLPTGAESRQRSEADPSAAGPSTTCTASGPTGGWRCGPTTARRSRCGPAPATATARCGCRPDGRSRPWSR